MTDTLTPSQAVHRRYLASEMWGRRRAAFRVTGGRVCVVCGDPRPDVHHLQYRDGEYLRGLERDADLILLCRQHHDYAHAHDATGWYRNLRTATMAAIWHLSNQPVPVPAHRRWLPVFLVCLLMFSAWGVFIWWVSSGPISPMFID